MSAAPEDPRPASPCAPVAELDFLDEKDRLFLDHLGRELARDHGVLFAGAGLSFNARRKDGGPCTMPSWNQLAESLRQRLGGELARVHDVLRIADYFETVYGREALVEAVAEAVRDAEHVPGRVHRELVGLGFREILTTNFDTLLERAFRSQHISPQVVTVDRDLTRRRQPPRILKANGCLERGPSKIVITGDDFLAYAAHRPLIETFVLECFVDSQVVFVGFGLEDPAFRAINERVLRALGRQPPMAYSLQFGADDAVKTYWRSRGVQIVDLWPERRGGPPAEERMYRVLRALRQVRTRLRRPPEARRDALADVAPTPVDLEAANRWHADLRAGLGLAAGADETVAGEPEPPAPWTVAAAHLACLAAQLDDDGARPAAVAALGRLLRRLCPQDGPAGPEPAASTLLAVQELVERVVADLGAPDARAPEALARLEIRVLCLLASFHGLVHLPYLAAGGSADPGDAARLRRRAGRCLIDAFAGLRLDDLTDLDLGLRSRFLTLLALLGPVAWIARLVELWVGPDDEARVLGAGARAVERTPDEDRIPLLGFHGVLQRTPGLFNRAADSLWSRHMTAEGELGHDDMERARRLAFRYRHLLQAAGQALVDEPDFQLHEQRLEGLLGRLFLEDARPAGGMERAGEPAGERVAEDLHRLWLELERGWVFGSPPPAALREAWAHAAEARPRDGSRVPWLALVLLTLPVAPELLDRGRYRLLDRAWRRGELELPLVVDHVAVRLRAGGFAAFRRVAAAERGPSSAPIERYEIGLARLVRWLFRKIDGEALELGGDEAGGSSGRRLRRHALERLFGWSGDERRRRRRGASRGGVAESNLLGHWLRSARSAKARGPLLEVLAIVHRWDPEPAVAEMCERIYDDWLLAALQVVAGTTELGLDLLDPPSAAGRRPPVLSHRALRRLLALASVPGFAGDPRRRELETWLCAWFDPDRLPADLRRAIPARLVEWLRPGLDPDDFHAPALTLAGRLGAHPGLRGTVEERLASELDRGDAAAGAPLRTLVVTMLQRVVDTPAGEARSDDGRFGKLWRHTWDLVPFADQADDGLVELVRLLLEQPPSPFDKDREGLASLLLALLREAPQPLRREHGEAWREHLEGLVEAGVTGAGEAGPTAGELSSEARLQLQKNLIRALHRSPRRRVPRVAGWIARTLETSPVELPDLEETLLEAIDSQRPGLARASLEAVLDLAGRVEGFSQRHRHRLRRIRVAVEAQGEYRPTSRFAALLARLPAADGT